MRTKEPLASCFWKRTKRVGPCLEWQGHINASGYGAVSDRSHPARTRAAHRVSWELAHGPVPDGLCVLHRCDNRRCVDPAHLFLGTRADNWHDALRKGRARWLPPRRGEEHGRATLTDVQVVAMRAAVAAGDSTARIATELGVTIYAVQQAVSGTTFSHLPGPLLRKPRVSDKTVRAIREMVARGRPITQVARSFNVAYNTVRRYVDGATRRSA